MDILKVFDKIQYLFMIKQTNTQQTGNRRELPQLDEGIYEKLTPNIILKIVKRKKNENLPPTIRNKRRMFTLTTST